MTVPVASNPLATISHARLERLLACPLRIAFEQARPGAASAAPSSWAAVGLAVHRAIDLCLDEPAPELRAAWEQACDEVSQTGVDPRSAPSARRSFLRLQRRLPELLTYIDDRGPSTALREHVLTSPDGTVTGQVDLILLGSRPSIVDHKTGLVLTDGTPREEYERQLAIYAWLVEVALGVDVSEGVLFSLRDGVVRLDVSSPIRGRIIDDAMRARSDYNSRAPGAQPAAPSERACAVCPYVGRCDAAWNALRDGTIERFGWGEAARGVVRAPITIATNGVAAVPISIDIGTVHGEGVLIDVPVDLVAGSSVGDALAAWRFALRSEVPLSLAWRDGASIVDVVR